eukprot:TRINITY_DN111175_c0_g1_i1.p1 TRINITY_DN111175_c0_g1~~TRINITY_DN111175_c0_g1_i1.p1  ORF type:complete len:335 (+),score=38.69 TRINITY_DN111175_c0_g1_i1:83-1087(+)
MASATIDAALLPRPPPGLGPPTRLGELGVIVSALVAIGSVPALPVALVWLLWRAVRCEPGDERRRRWRAFAAVLAFYIFLGVVPLRPWPWLMQTRFWQWWVEYFSVRVAYRGGKPLSKQQYFYFMWPHGLYPFSGACAGLGVMVDVFHGMRIGSAPAGFLIPVLRQLMVWVGCIGADKASLRKALKRGDSVGIYPGGIGEMLRTNATSEQLLFRGRKGAVQLALENNVPIVPVYTFGQSVLWNQLLLPSFMERLSRWLRLSIMLPYGRFGTLVPRKIPLWYAIGEPIVTALGPGETVTDALVEATHARALDAVKELYDFYKGLYGWSNRRLFID